MKNKKNLMTIISKPNNIKTLMIISGVLLAVALIGVSIILTKPTQVKQKTALVSYTQKGQFDYAVYLKPSYLYGPTPETTTPPAQYPLAVVGNIDFTYTFQPAVTNTSGIAWVEAVLENPGIWQKKLQLVSDTVTGGDFTLNFSLDMQEIDQLFSQIESETSISPSSRNVTLNAYFQSGSDLQVQSLPLTIGNNLIKIPNSLRLIQEAGSGQFDYKINPVLPVAQPPNVKYPAAVVDSLDFTYTFVPVASDKAAFSVQAILENPGIWQKTLTLVSPVTNTGKNGLNFQISVDQLQQQFDTIDKETGLTTSPRLVTLQVTVSSGTDSFVQSLPLIMKQDVLEVGGTLQEQQASGTGRFDYVVNLKPNSIFNTTTLKPPVAGETSTLPSFELSGKPQVSMPSPLSKLQSGQTAFINLIDKMDVRFDYQFAADNQVNNLKSSVDIVATLEAPQSWSKNFDLLQTENSGNFSLDFPVDLSSYNQLLASIHAETGVSPQSYNLTVTANIHTTGETPFGKIDQTFSPTMKGTIAGNILTWDKDLSGSKTGAINQTTTVENPSKYFGLSVSAAKILFVILTCIFGFFFLGLIVFYFRHRGLAPSNDEREMQKIQKRYGARIAESNGNSYTNEENPVLMNSMEDLIKVADELGKPVVHQSAGPSVEVQSFYVIDGNTRYQYSLPKNKSEQWDYGREVKDTAGP